MKLNKYDIGGEVISILTKGMYPDPKDALREYIQNGVDAGASSITIKIRQDLIIIEDNGKGMNQDIMRKAVRVGISEKNPSKNVGFLGIGIYSSFHLCDRLTIFSRGSENTPNKLEIDFGGMRATLDLQKEKRLNGIAKPDELIDLQTLLEQYIYLSEKDTLKNEEFPFSGTRVELSGIETEFYSALSNFDDVAEYLRSVIPLPFDKTNFIHAEQIEQTISEICKKHKQTFEIINLQLQINAQKEFLFRPYSDKTFSSQEGIKPLKPLFISIQNGDFYGVAWGCLNTLRKKVEIKSLRGFILKKQGFSIGKRESMVKYFQRGNTFFDRFSGEIIIVNPQLIPNASRSELEYSPLRTLFYEKLTRVAEEFDTYGLEYQMYSKGDEELSELNEKIKIEIGSYNENEGDPEVLVNKIIIVKDVINEIQNRIDRKGFRPETLETANKLLKQVKELESVFQNRLKVLTESKKKKQQDKKQSALQVAKKLSKLQIEQIIDRKNYESLFELLTDLEFKIDDDLKEVLFLIDERFIQKDAKTREEYYAILNELKNEILNNN